MRQILRLLLFAAVLAGAPSSARADEESDARRAFVEVARLATEADRATSLARRIELLGDATARLDAIVLRYPGSEVALGVATGGKIGGFDTAELRRKLTAARLRDPGSIPSRVLTTVKRVLYDTLLGDPEAPKLKLAEPISLEERNGTLRLLFRDARLAFEGDAEILLGDVVLKVTPEPADRYRFSVDLPARLAVRDLPDGPELTVLTMSDSRLSGTWSARLQAPTQLFLAFGSVRMFDPDRKPSAAVVTIGRFELNFAYADWSRRIWFGPLGFKLADLRVDPEPGFSIEVDEIELKGQSDGVSQATWLRMLDILGVDVARGAVRQDTDALRAFAKLFGPMRWGGFDLETAFRGIRLVEDGETLMGASAGRARLSLDAAGEAASLGVVGEAKGMAIDDPYTPQALVPTEFAFDIRLERLPLRSLAMTLLSTAFRLPPTEGRGNIELEQVDLFDLLHGPPPGVRLVRLEGRTPALAFGLSGALAFDLDAPLALSGRGAGWVEGLEAARHDEKNRDVGEMFDDLIGLGRKQGARHGYDLELDSRGMILVNGQDIGPLEP